LKVNQFMKGGIMNTHPSNVIGRLRELMPSRPLADHEARGVAERQAIRFLVRQPHFMR
jgi:hypothetical protein